MRSRRPPLPMVLCAAATLAVTAGCRARTGAGGAPVYGDGGAGPDLRFAVYPLTEGPTDPLVETLCAALHRTAARRHAECCAPTTAADGGAGGGGAVIVGVGEGAVDCARRLGYALRGGAVRLDAAEVDRCAGAMSVLYQGCDWLGFEPLPAPPECRGIVHGLLPRDAGCRSSIECEKNLHCQGATAGRPGTCRPPHGHGALCDTATSSSTDDPLAALILDDHLDETHPYCSGHCERGRCVTPITATGPCEKSSQCAPGYHCAKQRCFAGWLNKAGQSCEGRCEPPARCLKGTCTVAGKEGVPCAIDDECIGRCIHPSPGQGDTGRCGPACGRAQP